MIIAAIGLGLSAIGTVQQFNAAKDNAEAQKKAEDAREKAQNFDAMRRRRQLVREMLLARSNALSNTTSRGAAEGSALPGLYGQASNEANTGAQGVEVNRQLGSQIFDANRQQAQAQQSAAMGQAFSSIGGQMVSNRDVISRVGTNAIEQF